VGVVITDPPFNAGKDFANDSMSSEKWAEFCERFSIAVQTVAPINLLVEVGKNDSEMKRALDRRFPYRWAIALNYTNAMRNGAVGYSNFGLVLWYGGKVYKRFMDRIDAALESTVDQFSHPSPKEPKHYTRLVEMFSQPGQTVLDPFMGSGTTGIAAHVAGRSFIGIEEHEPFFNIACERIENAQRQGRLIT
jgi:DNA modification methylase